MPAPGSLASYDTAGQVGNVLIDVTGAIYQRGPVLTDEGGKRDDFPGVALDAMWTSFITGLGTITVAGSIVSFNVSGLAAIGDRAFISRPIDYLPMIANMALAPVAARVAGYDFYWGFYNTLDPALATSFVEQRFLGSQLLTQAVMATQGAVGDADTTGNITVTTTAAGAGNCSWRTIALDGEAAIYRDANTATNALPTVTARLSLSRHLPGLYEPLFFAMGIRLSTPVAGPVVAANTYGVDTIFVKNVDRLVVNTAF